MACKKKCAPKPLTEEQKQVLKALADCDEACATKDIAAATGLESKAVSCRITSLKKKGLIISPARCRYEITGEGKKAIN